MASGKMKVHAYRVHKKTAHARFENLLETAALIPLEKRLRTIVRTEMRLEQEHRPREEDRHQYWLLNFTKMRFENGPGKASRKEPIEGFDLAADEGFGEETAALYDVTNRHMLVQYNHYGPRAGSIATYLASCGRGDEGVYEFQLRLDEQADARLAQKQIITKIQYKVAPPKMTAAMREAGVPIERALQLSADASGQTIEIIISAGRGRLAQSKIMKTIEALKRIVRMGVHHNELPVETFKVSGRENVDSSTEEIDMLFPVMELEVDGLVLGNDRRYTVTSRWDALLRARAGWQRTLRP